MQHIEKKVSLIQNSLEYQFVTIFWTRILLASTKECEHLDMIPIDALTNEDIASNIEKNTEIIIYSTSSM